MDNDVGPGGKKRKINSLCSTKININKKMKKGYLNQLSIFFFIFFFIHLSINNDTSFSADHNTRTSLQQIIDNAKVNDTIILENGNYYENILINNSINIQGKNKEQVQFTSITENCCITINSDYVTIENLSFQNTFDAIRIKGKNIRIINCIFFNISNCSIDDSKSNNLYYYNNTFFNLNKSIISTESTNINIINSSFDKLFIPIFLFQSNYATIRNNKFNNILYSSIFCLNCISIKIINNYISNCSETGITNVHSNIIISDVIINNCTIGIESGSDKGMNYYYNGTITNTSSAGILFYTSNHEIKNFEIYNNNVGIIGQGARKKKSEILSNIKIYNNDIGIYFDYCEDQFIKDCIIMKNQIGVSLKNSIDNTFMNNTIKNNPIGVKCLSTSKNTFYHNDFIFNDKQVSSNSDDRWYLDYPLGGNYWSDYTGKDIKKGYYQKESGSDGIGDVPYDIYLFNGSWKTDKYPLFKDRTPPKANAGFDRTIDQGEVYHFDGRSSSDDQMIIRYNWEWDYGGSKINISYQEFKFKFDIAGFYQVKLTVFDFADNNDSDTVNITVRDIENPIPLFQGDIIIEQGETAFFDASPSSDNSGIANYSWKFQYGGRYIWLYGMTSSFRFDIPGYYEVTFLLFDTAENFASVKFNVTVIDTESPVAVAGDDVEIENGDSVLFDASLSTDNGVLIGFNWRFNYDGQNVDLEGEVTSFDFIKPGYYEVRLSLSDEFGNNATDSLKVTVIDTHPPKAVITGILVQTPGGTIRLNGLTSTDNGRIVGYHWKLTDLGPLSVEGPYLNHTFERKGRHYVTLTVFDEWNLSGSVTVNVDVIDQQKPTASAGADATIPVGTLHTFNGSGSTDDGIMERYRWTFEYDGEEKNLLGETVQFKFDKGGTYHVLLTVTDQTGNWGEDRLTITVVDKGTLKGTVMDKKGSPIKGAKVTVKASDGKDYVGISSANGSFVIDVSMGEVTYEITKPGYKSASGTTIIRPMETTVLDKAMTTLEDEANAGSLIVSIVAGFGILLLFVLFALMLLLRMSRRAEKRPAETMKTIEVKKEDGQNLEAGQNIEPSLEEPQSIADKLNDPPAEEVLTLGNGPFGKENDEFFPELDNGMHGDEEVKNDQ